jgi:uncharacterized membrane protein YukC
MKSFKNGLWLLLLAGLLGCGSSAERLFKEQIELMNQWADRMESGKPIDASEAIAMQTRMLEVAKKQQELKLSPEETKQLTDKYMPEMQKAMQRLMAATQKITGKPFPQLPGMPAGMRPPAAPEASKPADKEKEQTEESKPDDGKQEGDKQEDDKKPPSP